MREKIKKLTPKSLIRIYQKARYLGISALFFVCRLFPVKKNLVVFCSVWGYGDNAKYVAEELCRRKRAARKTAGEIGCGRSVDMEMVFITNHPEQVPCGLPMRALKTNSPAAILALSRARVWVDNNRKEGYIRKRRGQYYIQLWHGGIALKKIEGDCAQALGEAYIKRARKDSKNTDLFVSNSTFCTQMYRRAFWADCEIAEWGSPRNDRFLRETDGMMSSVLHAPAGENTEKSGSTEAGAAESEAGKIEAHRTKTAVYAPTYRGTRKSYCDFDADMLRGALAERFGGAWEILVRLHPLVAEGHDFSGKGGVKDISAAPDLYELLYGADVLITDYSNTMFEFSMTGKPVFLYADDLAEYERERGLYFIFEELPFPKAYDSAQLLEQIRNYRAKDYRQPLLDFFAAAGLKESGHAGELVADRIEKIAG